jgi:ribonuclease BN (tRNA processing enzyme)
VEITFLGTGNAIPRRGRGQTCLYVEADGLGHVLDCGDAAPTKLLLHPDLDWSRLRALVVTHLHPDHAAGLFVFLHLLHMLAKEHPDWLICRGEEFRLCLPQCEGSRCIADCLSAFHIGPDDLAFTLACDFYRTGEPFAAGALTVDPWPTSHADEAHGITIEHEGKRVVFSGDLGEASEITEPARGADMVITECAHFHPTELVTALKDSGTRHVVITHMHDRLLDRFEELEDSLFDSLRDECALTFARDGLVLTLDG